MAAPPPPSYDVATGTGFTYGGGYSNPPNQGAPYPPGPGAPFAPGQGPALPPMLPGRGIEGFGYGAGQPPSAPTGYAPPAQDAGFSPPPQNMGFASSPQPRGYDNYSNTPSAVPSTGYVQPGSSDPFHRTASPKPAEEHSLTFNSPMGDMRSFSDKAVRHAFIKKVYLILLVQLSLTTGFVCLFLFEKNVQNWVQRNQWFYYVSYGIFLVTYITLVCCPGFRRNHPWNFVCLAVFTLAFSYMTGTIASFYNTNIVLYAAIITCAVCLAISLFAIQTKIDFTMCSGLMFALSMVLFFFGFACIIIFSTGHGSRILECVYGGLAALVFSLFLVYDTQMIIGGRKHELSPEEYVYGALQLYLDVVYIFIIILSLFGKSD